MPGLSAAARIQDLEGIAHEFNQHLLKTPGNVLNGNFRCAIAQCARDALRDCSDCQTLSRKNAARAGKGGDIYRTLAKLHHEPPLGTASQPHHAILNLVHALVNHHTKLTAEWYQATSAALQEARLVPDALGDKYSRQFMIWSLYCEICLLTAMSHAIHMAFLILDRDPPPLPQTSSTVPTLVDFQKIKRKDRKIHDSDSISVAPYLKPSDLNISSPELKKLSPDAFQSLLRHLDLNSANVAMIFAPQDLAFWDFLEAIWYVPRSDRNHPHKALDSTTRCTDHITRYDLETVALAVATSCDSQYCQSHHKLLQAGTKKQDKLPDDHSRTVALQRLAQTVTMRPFSIDDLDMARNTILTDHSLELLVEAAGMIALVEAQSKIVDSTGRTPSVPLSTRGILNCTLLMFRCFS